MRCIAFPFLFPQPWLVNMAFFVLMYAGLAQAWNVLGGYSGYVSLGHAAFFGLGAYAEAILFSHIDIGSSGYLPFLVLPAIGLGVALASVPIAWVALRTRALTFAIVTLTLLFVVQTLAFNLRWLTNGSQGLSVPSPSFFPYERPFYLCVLGIFALATLVSWHVRGDKLGLVLFAIRDDEDRVIGLGAHVSRGEGVGVRDQRRADGDGRRRVGVLPRFHLPAVRDRPAGHDRHRPGRLPRRDRAPCGGPRSARSSWFPRSSGSRTSTAPARCT